MFKPLNKIVLGILMLSLFTACNSTTTTHISGKATAVDIIPTLTAIAIAATTPQPAFPSFSDWRAAYMASNQVIHAVTLDGKTDISGPTLTQYSNSVYPVNDGIAPDGHTFAYTNLTSFDIVDLRTGFPVNFTGTGSQFSNPWTAFWSQNGRYLAIGDNEQGIGVIDLTTRIGIPVPLQLANEQRVILLGWIDTAHVAIYTHIGDTNGQFLYESVSIPDGHQQVITSLAQHTWNGAVGQSMSPDGSQILVSNVSFRDTPYTPLMAVISTSTGKVRNLPAIVQAMGSGFTTIAWQPGHPNSVDVSTGFNINGNGGAWALNLQTDTATHLVKGWYPTDWSPDGKTLILSTESRGEGQTPPFSIEAMTFDGQGRIASQTLLTKQAYGFPFIGFIKTAGS